MNTKHFSLILLIVLMAISANAQVAINNDNSSAVSSAMLDVKSTTKGILIPRMTSGDRNFIGTPVDGLLVYDITTNSFWFYDNGNGGWLELVTTSGTTEINDLGDAISDGSSIFMGSTSGNVDDGGNKNAGLGDNSLHQNTSGTNNAAFGSKTLEDNTTGEFNTGIGSEALRSNINANYNSALGYGALANDTSGDYNTAIGALAHVFGAKGSYNTALGYRSLRRNKSGDNNVVIGSNAGSVGASFSNCIMIGYEAGKNNSSSNKLFIDNSSTSHPLIGGDFSTNQVDINGRIRITGGNPGAGKVLTSDMDGVASWTTKADGATEINELSDAKTNSSSIFFGTDAGKNTSNNGTNNIAIGLGAFRSNGSSDYNIAIGSRSSYRNIYADHVIAIGDSALYNNGASNVWGNVGDYNIGIGDNVLMNINGQSGNTAIGHNALQYVNGYDNTVIGYGAGKSSSGNNYSSCIMIGNEAGANNTTSDRLFIDVSSTSTPLIGGSFATNQVDINGTIKITGGSPGAGKVLVSDADGLASWGSGGASALNDLSDAYTDGSNIFVGAQVGGNDNGGNYNTIFGDEAFKNNISGQHNTGFGYKTLELNTGGSNSAFGISSLRRNTSGENNIAFGFEAMYYNQTGSNNVAIGYEAGESTNGSSFSGCVFLGNQAGKSNTLSNKLFIDNSSTTTPLIGGDFSSNELYFNADAVGIGTTSPNELFEIAGTGGNTSRMIVSDGQGSNRRTLLFVSPSSSYSYARLESYKYGTGAGGLDLRINTVGGGRTLFGGNVEPDAHKGNNLGSNTKAWDNVYADDYITLGSAAFANINVTKQLLNFPPQEKKEGAFDEFTDKGAKELDPASLPASLTEDNALLIDEITTYNYKANYEQQQQIEALKKENASLKARLDKIEAALLKSSN